MAIKWRSERGSNAKPMGWPWVVAALKWGQQELGAGADTPWGVRDHDSERTRAAGAGMRQAWEATVLG